MKKINLDTVVEDPHHEGVRDEDLSSDSVPEDDFSSDSDHKKSGVKLATKEAQSQAQASQAPN